MFGSSSRLAEIGFLALRVMSGLLFAEHGLQKVFGLIGGTRMSLGSEPGVAGVIELTAGLLIALGVRARWAAFIASGEMAVAYFTVHARMGFWPVQNHGELAVIYCFVFLFIAAHGGGKLALVRD